jgi:endo-alpha-1,4-polygalactosaminidase (GH114 family)
MPELLTKPKNVIHYPQLDTVLMVEKFIYDHSGEYKKKSLWENLPKQMMYQTFCLIIDYLTQSGKIAVDKEEKIAWIWDSEGVKKYLARKDLSWN